MYQGKVFYNNPQQPNDLSPYIEIIEYNENHTHYSRPTDASTEEDDGYMKPEDETECPYYTIEDVIKVESQNDQREHSCHTSEDETNIEEENTTETNKDIGKENITSGDNKISICCDKRNIDDLIRN